MDTELVDRLNEILERVNDVHAETKLVNQKVDLKLEAVNEKIEDLRDCVEVNTQALSAHVSEDDRRFNQIETRHQVTRAKLGMLALFSGGGALSLSKLWEWLSGR